MSSESFYFSRSHPSSEFTPFHWVLAKGLNPVSCAESTSSQSTLPFSVYILVSLTSTLKIYSHIYSPYPSLYMMSRFSSSFEISPFPPLSGFSFLSMLYCELTFFIGLIDRRSGPRRFLLTSGKRSLNFLF